MGKNNLYVLPQLPYDYKALAPHISEEQLRLHHDRHHQAYVKAANSLYEKLAESREKGIEPDMKSIARELSFNIGGHILHSFFWENMKPSSGKPLEPKDAVLDMLKNEFGSFERFKNEFSKAALTAEGSGWAVLSFCSILKKPVIMQVEKHNLYVNPAFAILLVIDVWEHAYYLDYKNERVKFIDAFWNIVNWDKVAERLKQLE
ncbi:MAG TPA: superoxide dismutase [Candidatus Omnitrophota bacterium]|nr:superoxide dismutase [Candidatus Omnitrophota bacterium]